MRERVCVCERKKEREKVRGMSEWEFNIVCVCV